uniref:Uncharacterized protein n=1 Tax=Rhabditophanes sp. KR3021 TaxID=114890 RepID=A0AC35TXS8_9BILA
MTQTSSILSKQMLTIFAMLGLFCVLVTSATPTPKDSETEAALRQYMTYGRNPDLLNRMAFRRWAPQYYGAEEDLILPELLKTKRNNAEMVNHIVKNFHALGRLEDLGRK